VATVPQNDELFNSVGLTGQVKSLQELQGFERQDLAAELCLQGEMMVAEGKRTAAAALDPPQLLAGAPPLKQQRWDASEALPGMTAMEALPGMAAMEALPGMIAMEALPGMAACATQVGAIPPTLLPTPAATVADMIAGACAAVVPPQPLSGTLEQATARLSGAVKSFNAAKGFGFISCEGIAEDIFFLRSELPGGLATGHADQGQLVGFEIQLTPDGRYRAARISLE